MVLYVSVQLSLFTCCLIAISCAGRSAKIRLPCPSGYLEDSVRKLCVQRDILDTCGKNMALKKTESSEEGSCVCRYAVESSGFGRPQVPSENRTLCWNLGERGDCPQGQVLVPVSPDRLCCGDDACASKEPENATGRSTSSEKDSDSEYIFNFTYKGECYRTETRAFCEEGHVVRFVVPSKAPACARWFGQGSYSSGSTNVKLTCGDALIEDRPRSLCMPVADFD